MVVGASITQRARVVAVVDLWSHVSKRPSCTVDQAFVESAAVVGELHCEAEITDGEVSVRVDEDVLWLQVAVNDA